MGHPPASETFFDETTDHRSGEWAPTSWSRSSPALEPHPPGALTETTIPGLRRVRMFTVSNKKKRLTFVSLFSYCAMVLVIAVRGLGER